jgi:hypothetical protein
MKRLTILLFSILISFNSFGEWTKFLERNSITTFIDLDTTKVRGDTVYWWEMKSSLKPMGDTKWLSVTSYRQGDCSMNRFKILAFNTYTESMAKGTKKSIELPSKWRYPEPMTIDSTVLEGLCPEHP